MHYLIVPLILMFGLLVTNLINQATGLRKVMWTEGAETRG